LLNIFDHTYYENAIISLVFFNFLECSRQERKE